MDIDFKLELEKLKEKGLLRKLKTFERRSAVKLLWEGREVINFASNDYLGLASDERVMKAAEEGIRKFGLGSGASRLVSGNLTIHEELEGKLATFKRKEKAIVFPTGYMANVGVVQSIVGKGDLILIDKLSHASIIDACRMSEADLRVFPHKNYERLKEILSNSSQYCRRLIITDTVFSMDGDLAGLSELVRIKSDFGAILMIDEAHGTGIFGEGGRGLAEAMGVENEIDITMGTFSKALGGVGGYVTGSEDLICLLQNQARSFIYTTGIPPGICAGIIKAIEIVETNQNLRERLWRNVKLINEALKELDFNLGDSQSPIIPIVVGENKDALYLSKELLNQGFFIPAMRYPTVPKGKARLRLTLSSCHSKHQILSLVQNLKHLFSFQSR